MKTLIKKLEKELQSVNDNFDYYDDADSTKKLIESEKRQIKRLIMVVKTVSAVTPKGID